MSNFANARKAKNEERDEDDRRNAFREQQRNTRLRDLGRNASQFFGSTSTNIGVGTKGDTLTLDRNKQDYIDVTVLDDNQYLVKVGGVQPQHITSDWVREGRKVQQDEIHRVILDWFDGDLL